MPGDKIKAASYAWYQPTGMDNSHDLTTDDIVANLLDQLVSGIPIAGKGTSAQSITRDILQSGKRRIIIPSG